MWFMNVFQQWPLMSSEKLEKLWFQENFVLDRSPDEYGIFVIFFRHLSWTKIFSGFDCAWQLNDLSPYIGARFDFFFQKGVFMHSFTSIIFCNFSSIQNSIESWQMEGCRTRCELFNDIHIDRVSSENIGAGWKNLFFRSGPKLLTDTVYFEFN